MFYLMRFGLKCSGVNMEQICALLAHQKKKYQGKPALLVTVLCVNISSQLGG